MARPIEPTPVLEGAAADRLLAQLESVCTPAEARARIDWAKQARAEMMRPKLTPSAAHASKLESGMTTSKCAQTPSLTARSSTTTEISDDENEKLARCSLWICLDCGWRDWGARAIGALNCCERCGSPRLDESDADLGCGPPGSRAESLAFG